MIAHPFGQMAVMMDLIAGGVMDRFPALRVGFFRKRARMDAVLA